MKNWTYEKIPGRDDVIFGVREKTEPPSEYSWAVATVFDEQNARLITAAPAMLEALKKCRDALIRYLPPETKLYEIGDANQAIAKAEGKSK